MRLIAPAAVSLAALLVLAGCSSPDDGDAGAEPGPDAAECAASGPISDAVVFDDSDPAAPSAAFDAPLTITATESSVLTAGDGAELYTGAVPLVDISFFNGASGELSYSTGHGLAQSWPIPLDATQLPTGLVDALVCAQVGDRVVGAIPASEGYGAQGNEALGIGADEPFVVVIDILDLAAPPESVEWENPPAVDFSDTLPVIGLEGEPPAELLVSVLETGDGPLVRYGESVTVDYLGLSWDSGEVFDESYSSAPRSFSTAGVVEGFSAAIVGKPVGSTVLVSMPAEYGYGVGTGHELADQTLVFLVEIHGIVE